jgi:YfiH family protein
MSEAADTWTWRGSAPGPAEVLFTGRGPLADREQLLARCAPSAPPLAWARQVHSAQVLDAIAGDCGQGDALVTGAAGLALSVVTADCVPVLLAGPQGVAAVHAGWRGIAGGVIAATLERIAERLLAAPVRTLDRFAGWHAWVGPAIGPCCYEVGDEVAAQVIAASGPEVATAGAAGRPHLDLQAAAQRQLAAGGVEGIEVVRLCTRCRGEWLYSYRREGRGAGRNVAFVWRPRGSRSKARS